MWALFISVPRPAHKPAELFGVSLWNGRVTVLQGDHSGRRLTSKGKSHEKVNHDRNRGRFAVPE
ncbi:hypothetical protein KVMX100_80357 [Klebsiella variicola]|nr:hypothetical protein KVMX100_80357 [Klebsiella variicola]